MITVNESGLYRLMTWLSPSFPVGAYSYSHGIEYALEVGDVTTEDELQHWISGILDFGSGRLDAILFRSGWQAFADDDEALLDWAIETAATMRATKEMALESAAQGEAFFEILSSSWPVDGLARFEDRQKNLQRPAAYPVVVGVAAALSHIPLEQALAAYLHGFISNLVSAGVRLIPLGQTAGQRIIAALEPDVLASASAISNDTLDHLRTNIGSAAVMVDWSSMQHETQYTRIFRS